MIVHPEDRVADFAKAGSDIISVHAEPSATVHLDRTIQQVSHAGPSNQDAELSTVCWPQRLLPSMVQYGVVWQHFGKVVIPLCCNAACICPHLVSWCVQIKDLGVKAGVVLNPATPIETIQHVIPQVDLILLMSGKSLLEV